MADINKAVEKLGSKARDFYELFKTDEGQRVLAHLRSDFSEGPMADVQNPNATYFNLGQREVVKYIEVMMAAHIKFIESQEK